MIYFKEHKVFLLIRSCTDLSILISASCTQPFINIAGNIDELLQMG